MRSGTLAPRASTPSASAADAGTRPRTRARGSSGATSDADHAGVEGIVTTLFALLGFIVGSARLSDNSFFWHLRTGEYILDHGIPHGDVFSYTAPGSKWVAQSWLAELAYGVVDRVAGGYGLRVFTGLVGVGVFVLAYRLALRLSRSWPRAAGITLLSLGGVMTLWSARPLVLGVLFFVVLLWIVEVPDSLVGRHPLIAIPVVTWLWVNVHGSFALGAVYLGLHLLGRGIEGASPLRGRERLLLGGAAIGLVVSLANPYGLSLLTFPVELLSRGEILSQVIEWQSPDFRERWGIALAAWICLYVVALARGSHRVSRRDLVVTVPMVVLALWATRNIAIAPLVGLPVVARAFAVDEPRAGVRFRRSVVTVACAAIGFVVVVLAVGMSAERSFATRGYPVAAMRYLERNDLLGSRIFTDDADAGFVILRHWPEQRVFMDDRFDMFPTRIIDDYLDVSRSRPNWAKVLDRHEVEVVVWPKHLALATALDESGDWDRVHTDATFAVWLRA
jgi:hypothetical protein